MLGGGWWGGCLWLLLGLLLIELFPFLLRGDIGRLGGWVFGMGCILRACWDRRIVFGLLRLSGERTIAK